MSQVPSHYFDKPSPLDQSKKGRRKPWFGFNEPRHIDETSLEELEVGNDVYISVSGEGGDKAWEEEHESVTEWFYDSSSLCLIGGSFPDDHSNQLDEMAFACRARGERVIASEAAMLNSLLNGSGRRTLQKRGIEPWRKRTDAEREEIVLTTLANSARADEAEDSYLIARYRKLVPEIQVKKLCSDGGKGLVRLFDFLAPYVLDASNLSTNPVYNEDFFRKFGISTSPGQLPLSLQDRAFQQEYLLKRHSTLFRLCRSLISAIESREIPRVQEKRSERSSFRVGNFRSEITPTNCAEVADAFSDSPNSDPVSHFRNYVDERCSTCLGRGGREEGSKLLHCGRCKKIGRIQPYCSESCQKMDWRKHKDQGFCGTKLSSSSTVPIIDSTPSNPLRLYLLNKVLQNPKVFWFVRDQNDEEFGMSYQGSLIQIHESMRELALKALRDQDQPSIDLFAFAVIEDADTPRTGARLDDGVITKTPPSDEAPSNEDRKAQFRDLFGLTDDEKWKESLKRGRLELDKPGNLQVKAFYYIHRKYPPGQTDGERKEWLMLDTLSSREWTDSVEQLRAMMEVTLLAPLSFR